MDTPANYDVAENHAFWGRVSPQGYLNASPERGEKLIELLREIGVTPADGILELGCNVGRNLGQLWDAGFYNLAGIEVCEKAVKWAKEQHKDRAVLAANIQCASIEEYTKAYADAGVKVDVIYTMAVLFHMHPDSEWCFENIAKMVNKYLVIIEQEESLKPPRHYARCYKTIFEQYGLTELWHRRGFADLGNKYKVRVFTRVL